MKNFQSWKNWLLLVAILFPIILTSCDDDSENPLPADIAIGFEQSKKTVLENSGTATTITIAFESNAPVAGNITVLVNNETASVGDYTTSPAVANGKITLPVAQGDRKVSFTVTPIDNAQIDGEKIVEFVLSTIDNNSLELGNVTTKFNYTISDDESPKTVDFANAELTVKENASVEVVLNFSGAVAKPSTIKISQSNLNNFTAGDYNTSPAFSAGFVTLVAPVGATEVSFTFTPVDNSEEDDSEKSVEFEISSADGSLLLGESITVKINITDDESVAEVITLSELRLRHTQGESITQNIEVEAVVTSVVGNTNGQNIVVQDATGGFILRFAEVHTFLRGDKVKVNLRGGAFDNFRGTKQVDELPLINAIKTGETPLPSYQTITIAQFNASGEEYESELVRFENVSFPDAGTPIAGSKTFTDGTELGNMFTNGGASFSDDLLPTGTGIVRGIAAESNGIEQIAVQVFEEDVFPATGGGGGGDTNSTIASVRAMYTVSDVSITEDKFIQGVVISSNDNLTGKNMFVQDASAGIELRFLNDNTFTLGEEVRINLKGGLIKRYNNGSLQIENLDNANAVSQGTGTLPTPRSVTLAQLVAKTFEGELVKVTGVTIVEANGTAPYNGNITFTNGSESVKSFIRTDAPFNGNVLPTGNVDVVGIASTFNGEGQITLRKETDVTVSGGGGGGGTTVASIRAKYVKDAIITEDLEIEAVVTSVVGNTNGNNIVIQDGTAGIVLRFKAPHSFLRGDKVKVNLKNGKFGDFRGTKQVLDLELASATKTGTAALPAYQTITVAQFNASGEDYESELVRFVGISFPDAGSTLSGEKTFTDGTGTGTMFTNASASFSGQTLPSGTGVLRGIASESNGKEQLSVQVFTEDVFP